ncbi:unnamed protein product [Durusdinium trenchii]|uniref:Bestrophin homolog n=2 Tax=Durusdinium trenchii TaxID=1381693 RepID=A0ABP0KG30_9DINO
MLRSLASLRDGFRTKTGGRFHRRQQPWAPKVLVSVGLSGSVLLGVVFANVSSDDDEKIWITRRGPFNLAAQRAVEWAPLVPCFGSGVVAALLSKYMPKQVKSLRLPISVHELTALPLSILLAFRFQLSYERWWASRQHLQEVGTNAIAVAMCSANNQEVISLDRSGEAKPDAQEIEENERRMLGLLDAACCLAEQALSIGRPPHPANSVEKWEPFDTHLHPDDAKQIRQSGHPVHCCFDAIFTTIHRGQMLNVYSAELASGMYQLASNMFAGYKFCEMILTQPNPAPFAVHMRTILMVFCISFPFTIIGRVSPLSLMLMQSALSFSLLGIEFVSRQMEHPFGSDESDIPLRKVLGLTRDSIHLICQKHQIAEDDGSSEKD